MTRSTHQQPKLLHITRQFANYTLQTKLIISFLAVALLPLGILALANVQVTRDALIDEANQILMARAEQTALSIDNLISTNLDILKLEALLPDLKTYLNLPADQRPGGTLERELTAVLEAFRQRNSKYIASYAILDQQGVNLLDTNRSNIGQIESDREYFQKPLETKVGYVSPIQFFSASDAPALYFSYPILDSAGGVVGVLRAHYRAAVLQDIIAQTNDLAGPQSYAVLFDEKNIYIGHGAVPNSLFKLVGPASGEQVAELQAMHRLPANLSAAELSTNLPDLEQKLINSAEPYFTTEDIATGTARNRVAVTTLEERPWKLAFFQPQEIFLTPIETQIQTVVSVAIGIAVVVAGIAFGVGRFLATPIIKLTNAAQQVAGGDLTVRVQAEAQDEVGQLATAFNSMTARLQELIRSLETQIQERTVELSLSIEVGQQAAAIRELAELLPTIVEFIRSRFDLYYTQVYMIDDLGQNMILRAGTGSVGQNLLAQSHNLPVGPGSIVGQVAASRQAIVVPDTEISPIHKPNSLLPKTRSELAIPLIVEGNVIGVLDMQSDQVNRFTESNQTVFEAMATQLAISIDSAQQWAVGQEARRRAEEAVRRLTRESWAEKLSLRQDALGYAYDLSNVIPLKTNGSASKETESDRTITVPMVIQNQSIGELSIQKPALTNDEQAFLSSIAQHLAQKAENLRLFEETQQRATREQIARQITDKIRASRDIETALKTAAVELSKALGAKKAVIDLNITETEDAED